MGQSKTRSVCNTPPFLFIGPLGRLCARRPSCVFFARTMHTATTSLASCRRPPSLLPSPYAAGGGVASSHISRQAGAFGTPACGPPSPVLACAMIVPRPSIFPSETSPLFDQPKSLSQAPLSRLHHSCVRGWPLFLGMSPILVDLLERARRQAFFFLPPHLRMTTGRPSPTLYPSSLRLLEE